MKQEMSLAPLTINRVVGVLLISGLTMGFTIGQGAFSLAMAKKTEQNFLPPVASINPKLTPTSSATQSDNELEPVALSAVATHVLHTTPKVEKLNTDITSQFKNEQMESILAIQKKIDEADLEYLWQATVEKNPVIRFSLEKLATPPDLQTKQSSKFLTKTLSMLISGATMGSTMIPGGGMYRNMGSMAVGNALQNMVSGKSQITANALSPTEQIQLAGLIDELKMKLIHNYQDYKNTLQNLSQSHAITMKNNSVYSKALTSKNDLAIMAAGAAYYQSLLNETSLRQKAKLYRRELERLAGTSAVNQLELAFHAPSNIESASAQTEATVTTKAELIGPLPLEAFPSSALLKSSEQPIIGPELPPAISKATTKKHQKKLSTPDNSLPQPMEIGPTLDESRQPEAMNLPRASNSTMTDTTPTTRSTT